MDIQPCHEILDAFRVLADAVVHRLGMGAPPRTDGLPSQPQPGTGYSVEWLMYERAKRDLPVKVVRHLPIQVVRSVCPGSPCGRGERNYVDAFFAYQQEGRLIRRYDSGWMDMWAYDEPPTDQHNLNYRALAWDWRTASQVLYGVTPTLFLFPNRYSKFTISRPDDERWGKLRVSVWVTLSGPVTVPVRQSCRAFCRTSGTM